MLLAGTAFTVAFIIYGGKFTAVTQDPARAFQKTAKAVVSPTPQTKSELESKPQVTSQEQNKELPNSPGQNNEQAADILPVRTQPPAVFNTSDDIVVLTLLGIDTTPERAQEHMGWRSDSIAVCVIDIVRKSATVITVPRDTRAKIQKRNSKGKVVGERMDKINAAYAYGGGAKKYSHENALQAISNLLGLKLSYYASIDMDSIGPLADSMGGVELTLEDTVPGVGKKGETVLLKGEKATLYVRKRKGITGGSDIARTTRQQLFMKAAAFKLKSMGPVAAVPVLFASLGGRVRTNLSLEQMLALSTVLKGLDETQLEFVTLPGKGRTINGTSFYIVDPSAIKAIVRRALSEGEKEAAADR